MLTTMNSSSTQTNLVLDGLFALLACGKCKQTPARPVRFVTCGHFFCDSCVENDTVCRQCNMPVEPNEKRPHYTVAQLINYCTTIKEMILDLGAGDLWPLANAIHQLTTEQSETIDNTASPEKSDKSNLENRNERYTSSAQNQRHEEKIPQSDNASCVHPIDNQKGKEHYLQPENGSFVHSVESQKAKENFVQPENASLVHSVESQRSKENDLQDKNVSFVHSTQISQRLKENDLQYGNASFVHSTQISPRLKENDLQYGNTNFVHSTQITQRRKEGDAESETPGYIDPTQISPRLKENDLQYGNASFVHSTQISPGLKENDLQYGNTNFVHSTQISQRRREGNGESETPGYIDPTQFSPIRREVDSDSETPGYRDPTQVIHQLNDSNYDSETPGYRDPTQMTKQRLREQYSTNETAGYIDPSQVSQHAKKNGTAAPYANSTLVGQYAKRTDEELQHSVVETEPPSIANWQEDMELDVEDKDLFSPIPESNNDDTLAPETLEMEVGHFEGIIIPETLEYQENIEDVRDILTVANAKDLAIETEKSMDKNLINNVKRAKTLQRKTFPMSSYDTVGIADVRNSAMDTADTVKKAQPRLHRRLTDSAIDRRDKSSTDNFDTRSIPDVRDSFMDDVVENREAPVRQLRRLKRWTLDKKRQNGVAANERDPSSAACVRDSSVETLSRKEDPLKQLMGDCTADRGNWTANNDHDSLGVATMRDTETENKIPLKQVRCIRDLRLRRRNQITIDTRDTPDAAEARDFPKEFDGLLETESIQQFEEENTMAKDQSRIQMADDETLGNADIQNTAMEPVEPVEKAQQGRLRRTRDAMFIGSNETGMKDCDTLGVADMRDSVMEAVGMEKETPVKQLRRLSAWEIRQKRISSMKEKPIDRSVNQIGRLKNLALDRLNENSLSDRDTLDIADGADMAETANFETEYINEENSPTIQRNKIPITDRDITNIANPQDTAMEIGDTVDERVPPRQLRRLTDWPLNRHNTDSMNDSDTVDVSNVGDLVTEYEKIPDRRPLRQLRRIQNTKPANHTIRPSDFHEFDITNIQDFGKEKLPNRSEINDSATVDVSNVGDLLMESEKIPAIRPLRKLKRLQNSKSNSDSIIPSDLHGIDITNIQDFGKSKLSNGSAMDDSDTVDITNFEDLATQTEKITEIRPLRQLKRLQNSKPSHHSIIPSDLHGLDKTNIQDFGKEKLPNRSALNDSDTVDVTNVEDLATQTEKITEIRPLRQLKRLQNSKPSHHSIIPSDLHGLDTTNIQDFGKEKLPNRSALNDSDTVDVTNAEDLATQTEKISEIRPLRQLKRLQNSKPSNHSIIPSDLHGLDITNIQDFGKEKLPNRSALNDSDTVDVTNVEDLATQTEEVSEIRPLRQLRRIQHFQPGKQSIIPSDLRGVDKTNIEDFTEEQAPLVANAALKRQNLNMKQSSKMSPNDNFPVSHAAAGTSAAETANRTPLKQLRSVENLEIVSPNKIPAKKAKAKIIQLKPRRRTVDKSTTLPKAIPKNVNKRNAKGETLLHNACVKGQDDYVKALLEAGANPNTKDNANWTPLQEVVKLGNRAICEMLLQFGASPNTPGIENRTALHDASQNNKLEEAALLLRFNANRDVYDKYGRRPIDYAVTDEMRALLVDDNAVGKAIGEAACLNSTLDQSIIAPNTKVVVLPANLNSANKKALSQIASKLKIAVATSFRSGVTHIVVEANERNATDLTYYIMLAILKGIWILNSQWIAISADLNDISEIDLELFEVHGAPNPGTPERSRMNEEKQNPRLFNNCFFYFTIGARGTWNYGQLEFTKASLTTLVLAGQGEILRREPDPEDVKDNRITPFHVAHKPAHPLHRCSHYIIYMPGKDEPRIKYNMPHIKTLPLAWLLECIEKFALVDPILIGIS